MFRLERKAFLQPSSRISRLFFLSRVIHIRLVHHFSGGQRDRRRLMTRMNERWHAPAPRIEGIASPGLRLLARGCLLVTVGSRQK